MYLKILILWPCVVLNVAASKFRAAPQGSVTYSEEVQALALAMLCCMAALLGLILAVVIVCFLLDRALSWKHQATYYACRRQVQKVQEEALMKGKDLSLCPCCVECTSNTPAQKKVKFFCGHSYHLHCINRWFQENPTSVGSCPVCEVGKLQQELQKCCGNEKGEIYIDAPRDEAQTFILHSLNRRYPTIITEECLESWAGCNAELWITELKCPRYTSIFKFLGK